MFVFLVYNKGETNQNKNPISLTQSHDFIKHFPEADLKPTSKYSYCSRFILR